MPLHAAFLDTWVLPSLRLGPSPFRDQVGKKLLCFQNRWTLIKNVYEMLLLQVASEMGLMTLAWLVGKNFFLPELTNQLLIIKLIFMS